MDSLREATQIFRPRRTSEGQKRGRTQSASTRKEDERLETTADVERTAEGAREDAVIRRRGRRAPSAALDREPPDRGAPRRRARRSPRRDSPRTRARKAGVEDEKEGNILLGLARMMGRHDVACVPFGFGEGPRRRHERMVGRLFPCPSLELFQDGLWLVLSKEVVAAMSTLDSGTSAARMRGSPAARAGFGAFGAGAASKPTDGSIAGRTPPSKDRSSRSTIAGHSTSGATTQRDATSTALEHISGLRISRVELHVSGRFRRRSLTRSAC